MEKTGLPEDVAILPSLDTGHASSNPITYDVLYKPAGEEKSKAYVLGYIEQLLLGFRSPFPSVGSCYMHYCHFYTSLGFQK
jgi:hypothetical protein